MSDHSLNQVQNLERGVGGRTKGGGEVVDKEDRGREKQRVLIPPLTLRKTYLSTNKIKANACEPSLSFTQSFLCFSDFLPCLE